MAVKTLMLEAPLSKPRNLFNIQKQMMSDVGYTARAFASPWYFAVPKDYFIIPVQETMFFVRTSTLLSSDINDFIKLHPIKENDLHTVWMLVHINDGSNTGYLFCQGVMIGKECNMYELKKQHPMIWHTSGYAVLTPSDLDMSTLWEEEEAINEFESDTPVKDDLDHEFAIALDNDQF